MTTLPKLLEYSSYGLYSGELANDAEPHVVPAISAIEAEVVAQTRRFIQGSMSSLVFAKACFAKLDPLPVDRFALQDLSRICSCLWLRDQFMTRKAECVESVRLFRAK